MRFKKNLYTQINLYDIKRKYFFIENHTHEKFNIFQMIFINQLSINNYKYLI